MANGSESARALARSPVLLLYIGSALFAGSANGGPPTTTTATALPQPYDRPTDDDRYCHTAPARSRYAVPAEATATWTAVRTLQQAAAAALPVTESLSGVRPFRRLHMDVSHAFSFRAAAAARAPCR
ncbi:Hypothetical protein CINCED_3A025808 [Cinara cedri]|uniref:Secreted protein n=1 Tax=Cinara cedri TaxID=506608 RepID=A0A5E4MZ79_9HEMI|nr:Hypothetical protein CINCED_3A025808 [Cinara cedri]